MNDQNKQDYLSAMTYQTMFSPGIDFINYLGLAIVLLYSGNQIIKGKQTIGNLVAYMAYLKMLQNPIRSFTQMVSRFQQAVVSYGRIIDIYDSKSDIIDANNPLTLSGISESLVFDSVNFSYNNEIKLLKDINF